MSREAGLCCNVGHSIDIEMFEIQLVSCCWKVVIKYAQTDIMTNTRETVLSILCINEITLCFNFSFEYFTRKCFLKNVEALVDSLF